MDTQLRNPTTANPAPVVAPHCSCAGAGQWRRPGTVLDSHHDSVVSERCGCDSRGPRRGVDAYTLADEAASTIGSIDRGERNVHLFGYAHGRWVALQGAVERTSRFANLVLNLPWTFQLLKEMGARGAAVLPEILSSKTAEGILTGDYSSAASSFVDYWGSRAWIALGPSAHAVLRRGKQKASPDSDAD